MYFGVGKSLDVIVKEFKAPWVGDGVYTLSSGRAGIRRLDRTTRASQGVAGRPTTLTPPHEGSVVRCFF